MSCCMLGGVNGDCPGANGATGSCGPYAVSWILVDWGMLCQLRIAKPQAYWPHQFGFLTALASCAGFMPGCAVPTTLPPGVTL